MCNSNQACNNPLHSTLSQMIETPDPKKARKPWSTPRFIIDIAEVSGGTIVLADPNTEVTNARQKVLVVCTVCSHIWEAMVTNLIHSKRGCPSCANQIPWTTARFIPALAEVSDGKIVLADPNTMINRSQQKVSVVCTVCGHIWEVTVSNLINNKTGCPSCSGNVPWTTSRFIPAIAEVSNNTIVLANLNTEITSNKQKVSVACTVCSHIWEAKVNDLINNKTGCPSCANQIPWTTARFIPALAEVSDGKIVLADPNTMINHAQQKVLVYCTVCGHKWEPTVASLINMKKGCPICAFNGEHKKGHGYLYLLQFTSKNSQHLKFGITYDLDRRLVQHERHFSNHTGIMFTVEMLLNIPFDNYLDAEYHERQIKQLLKDNSIETLYESREHVPQDCMELLLNYYRSIPKAVVADNLLN